MTNYEKEVVAVFREQEEYQCFAHMADIAILNIVELNNMVWIYAMAHSRRTTAILKKMKETKN